MDPSRAASEFPRRIAVLVPNPQLRGGGEKHGLAIADALSQVAEVTVVTDGLESLDEAGRFHNLDLSRCTVLPMRRGRSVPLRAAYRAQVPVPYLRRLQNWEDHRDLRRLGFDLFVNVGFESTLKNPSPRGIFVCMFPHRPAELWGTESARRATARADRFARLIGGTSLVLSDSYQQIVTNSTFTAEWLRRWWGVTADAVIFPPCEDMRRPQIPRGRSILNVGRFVADVGDTLLKRQDVLVEAFAALPELHSAGWTLDLVGPVHDEGPSRAAVAALKERAAGLPVRFHEAIEHAELVRLMNQARIYWHATGLGSDPEVNPGNQEHFGMSTVEAMSAGAVPIVLDTAGARDSVRHGIDGIRWPTLPELLSATREVALNESRWAALSREAMVGARRFSREAFDEATLGLLTATSGMS